MNNEIGGGVRNRDVVDAALVFLAICMSAVAAYGTHELGVKHGREQMKEAIEEMAITDSEICLIAKAEESFGIKQKPGFYDVCE